MKFPARTAVLAAALFSMVAVIPWLPVAQPEPQDFFLEVQLASSVDGEVKVYFDVGAGYNETDSSAQPISKGPTQRCRLTLRAGVYRSIRFDPINGPGRVTIAGAPRIVSPKGRLIRSVALADLQPLHQIANQRIVQDRLEIATDPAADDPQLVIRFSPPLKIATTLAEDAGALGLRAVPVFVAILLLVLGWEHTTAGRHAANMLPPWISAHPRSAILACAGIAVLASAYPIVFLGKSYVSPNFGTMLVYEAYPTLPGDRSTEVAAVNGSDLGPALWQSVPYAEMERRALLQREWPLWNRYTLTGAPLLGQGQSMFGDPLHWLVLLGENTAWSWDLKYLLAKWLFAAGLGFLVYLVTRHSASALVVTFAAPFIGFFAYRINHPAFFSLCDAPWVLAGWIGASSAPNRRALIGWCAVGFAANFALLNSGTAKEAALLLLQMNVAGGFVVLASATPRRARLVRFAAAAWAGLLALLVDTPMWATFLDALPKAFTISDHIAVDQVQPSLLLGAFDELFYRPVSREGYVFNPSLNFLFLLGVLYFVATFRRHLAQRTALVLACSAALAAAVVFGVVPPTWIGRIPLIANVGHVDNCFSCGFIVFAAVLAGIGFATAAERLARPEGKRDLSIVVALLIALVFAWLGFRHAAHRETYGPGTTFTMLHGGETVPASVFIQVNLLVLLAASAVLGLLVRHVLIERMLTPATMLVGALCVAVLLWRHGMHAASAGFDPYVVQPPPRARFHATSTALGFVTAANRKEPARVFGVHGNLAPGWNALYGLETVHGPDALQNAAVRELIDASPVKWNSSWRVYVAGQGIAAARPFLDALNVRYYLDAPGNAPLADPSLTRVLHADLDVYQSRTAWPRAFFAPGVSVYSKPPELVARMLTSGGRAFAAVTRDDLAANPALAVVPHDERAAMTAEATNYRLTENSTTFDIHANAAGVVVLNEGWWPHSFRAELNGRRVPIVRVNHAAKGVVVPAAGDYTVRFTCSPRNFTRNLAVGGGGVALALGSLALAWWTTRRRGDALPKAGTVRSAAAHPVLAA